MVFIVSVRDTHGVNTVCTILLEVMYQKVSPLLPGVCLLFFMVEVWTRPDVPLASARRDL